MKKISLAVHGGAGDDSEYIQMHQTAIKKGLEDALQVGYELLEQGGTALDAVEMAVRSLEDNPHFNAGRGSELNNKGEVEMDASIMEGKTNGAGAVSIVRNVKNPISLARYIMEHTSHVFLSGEGALEITKDKNIQLEPDTYFFTQRQLEALNATQINESHTSLKSKRTHGTVGAVALDMDGNLAAATSTGGTSNCLRGRIGDSCIIGAGCYANNDSCAVSGTGDGELLITNVIAHSIAFYMELNKCSLQHACDYIIHVRNKNVDGDIGVIAVDAHGDFGICFNSQRMHRAWKTNDDVMHLSIYK
ncbi:MAG: isoaspartyl peptidase/L-asparaginase family protein [Flavobacterium sp.]